MELEIQKYLRSGKTLEQLEEDFKIEFRFNDSKISFNYNQIESPMGERICQECRGLILRKGTWDIVAYPFDKFFNYEEGFAAEINWKSAVYQEKLDGSLLIYYWDDEKNQWFFATRKVAEADTKVNLYPLTFAELAKRCLDEMGIGNSFLDKLNKNFTYMFELTSPFNRVCVDHQDFKLTMIGARDNVSLQECSVITIATELGFPYPREYHFHNIMALSEISGILEEINKWNPSEHEGLVVVDNKFNRVKIKTLPYKALHGTISSASASDRNLIRLVVLDKLDDIKNILVLPIKEKAEYMQKEIVELIEWCRFYWNKYKDIEDMKEFALMAQKTKFPAILFALKRNKTPSITEFIQGMVESSGGADKILDLIGIKNGYVMDLVPENVKEELKVRTPCISTFEHIAVNYPELAITLVKSKTLNNIELSWVAEYIGRSKDENEKVKDLLITLSSHEKAFVREGAIYGMENYLCAKNSSFIEEIIDQLFVLLKHEHRITGEIAMDVLSGAVEKEELDKRIANEK